ncbi:kinase-like protein [Phlegmacium glaucopus]|nr:kinase-like protein [Phlegmacium glaucopus]
MSTQKKTSQGSLSIAVTRQQGSEPPNRYEAGGYHPVNVGEVFNQRYKIVRKLGWGFYSTVWLVQDTRNQGLAAMKILIGDLSVEKETWDELGILRTLRDRNPQSLGYRRICQLDESFVHKGPNGDHICLVMEPLGLSLFDIYCGFPDAMPLILVKRIATDVLRALRYIHEECGVIHTDIKGDNILMTGAPPEPGQATIQLSMDDLMSSTFKLTDFGAANRMENRFAQVIQPRALRAPEVIIGADWDTKADIWNFGCLLYEFARGAPLFDPFWKNEESEMKPAETHLAQITGLFGQFPFEFMRKGTESKRYFDGKGHLLKGAGRYTMTLEALLSRAGHSPQEIQEVANFLSQMLVIDPTKRLSAGQLLEHPWLENVN